MFKLIKAYWRGFVGGPDFNRDINHRFILEDKQLTIKVPMIVQPLMTFVVNN